MLWIKTRPFTVPVYSGTAAIFPNMEEINEHYQRPIWQPENGSGVCFGLGFYCPLHVQEVMKTTI